MSHLNSSPSTPSRLNEFDFLQGHWAIQNRRLLDQSTDAWDEFDGEARCWSILDGQVSVEELRLPARNFFGMGLRVFNREKNHWEDFWMNASRGVLMTPPAVGQFIDGVGTFESDYLDGDVKLKVRGIWDQVTPNACRWHQEISRDNGAAWAPNWWMNWTRVQMP